MGPDHASVLAEHWPSAQIGVAWSTGHMALLEHWPYSRACEHVHGLRCVPHEPKRLILSTCGCKDQPDGCWQHVPCIYMSASATGPVSQYCMSVSWAGYPPVVLCITIAVYSKRTNYHTTISVDGTAANNQSSRATATGTVTPSRSTDHARQHEAMNDRMKTPWPIALVPPPMSTAPYIYRASVKRDGCSSHAAHVSRTWLVG